MVALFSLPHNLNVNFDFTEKHNTTEIEYCSFDSFQNMEIQREFFVRLEKCEIISNIIERFCHRLILLCITKTDVKLQIEYKTGKKIGVRLP